MPSHGRHPLEIENSRLRQQNAAMRNHLEAILGIGSFIPRPYAIAVHFARTNAYSQPITSQETPGRQHPASTPPGRNPSICSILDQEERELVRRAQNIESAVHFAVEHPDQTTRRRTA